MNPLPRFANLSDGGKYAAESMRAASDHITSLGGTSVVEVLPSWADVWVNNTYGFNPLTTYVPADLPFTVAGSSDGYDTNTSLHPGWYDALWKIGTSLSLPSIGSYEKRLEAAVNATRILQLVQDLVGPGSASYINEASSFIGDWKEAWWGPNYSRLIEIKKKYDPDMLLKWWKCIGFEDADVESLRYSCQGKLQGDVYRAIS
ncbi:FAD binding domain-containing protein [Diaporthe helianthi]|uniref:FAD binding domain-containing protein n=1 Tax=Diaporthe helianthi TaxID=158607 RepID=A0A2P5I6L9_DIAHE|nr:FAD binding domain-containing protein [Diaporthe helianthi]